MSKNTINSNHDYSEINLVQTSRCGDNLKTVFKGSFDKADIQQYSCEVIINPDKKFQIIEGIGGAFTESSAYVLNQLSEAKRNEIINAYFSKNGAAYSLNRTHINSCDFSLSNYSYAPIEEDKDLRHFSIREDLDDLVPLIKDALAADGASFKILASPWTAPPWMKDNGEWNGGKLLPEYYHIWANYFVKYIGAYRDQGIYIWGVTVENEPLGNGDNWESMIFSPEEMNLFVKRYLGPKFEEFGLNTKILIYDQNRDHLEDWADKMLGEADVARYVYGTAVHWYSSTTHWYPEVLEKVHHKYPDKHLIQTEGCIDSEVPVWKDDDWYWRDEATDWGYDWAPEADKHLHPQYAPVYRYACDIIGGLNSWLTGWIDWNIVLDSNGGPNHAENWCIAPVIVKPETDEIYYTPLFYIMNHFSKYFRPGANRISVESANPELMITACMNPDNSLAVAVLNQSINEVYYKLSVKGKSKIIKIPEHALQTVILK